MGQLLLRGQLTQGAVIRITLRSLVYKHFILIFLLHSPTQSLKGWCTWYKTWLQMIILGPLSRVMMVKQPFCSKKCRLHTFCVQNLVPPARFYICDWTQRYCDPTKPHKDLTPPQVWETMAPHAGFTKPCCAIVSEHLRWCWIFVRFSWITITLGSVANIEPPGGTKFCTQKNN